MAADNERAKQLIRPYPLIKRQIPQAKLTSDSPFSHDQSRCSYTSVHHYHLDGRDCYPLPECCRVCPQTAFVGLLRCASRRDKTPLRTGIVSGFTDLLTQDSLPELGAQENAGRVSQGGVSNAGRRFKHHPVICLLRPGRWHASLAFRRLSRPGVARRNGVKVALKAVAPPLRFAYRRGSPFRAFALGPPLRSP